jgi:hypothetical protein
MYVGEWDWTRTSRMAFRILKEEDKDDGSGLESSLSLPSFRGVDLKKM